MNPVGRANAVITGALSCISSILSLFLPMRFLLSMHPAVSVLLLCAVTVTVSYIGLRLVRRRFSEEVIRENHEVGGMIFNAFGLIYAVLVAFVVFVTWNEYNDSQSNVDAEASELIDIYNTSKAFPDSIRNQIQASIIEYIQNVKEDEWPLLENGEPSMKARASFHKLLMIYTSFDAGKFPNVPVYQESLKHLNDLSEKRRTRVFDSSSNIPGIIWASLLFGAIMTVVFTYFFCTRRFVPQLIMTSALTILNTLILYMIYLLDHPFVGTMKITPGSFEYAMNLIKSSL